MRETEKAFLPRETNHGTLISHIANSLFNPLNKS